MNENGKIMAEDGDKQPWPGNKTRRRFLYFVVIVSSLGFVDAAIKLLRSPQQWQDLSPNALVRLSVTLIALASLVGKHRVWTQRIAISLAGLLLLACLVIKVSK